MPANPLRDRLRVEKLRKLAASTSFAAEEETARRLAGDIEAGLAPPPIGSPEYVGAWREFSKKVGWLHCQLGSNVFDRQEIRFIKNIHRYGADPWKCDASDLQRVETLLMRLKEAR